MWMCGVSYVYLWIHYNPLLHFLTAWNLQHLSQSFISHSLLPLALSIRLLIRHTEICRDITLHCSYIIIFPSVCLPLCSRESISTCLRASPARKSLEQEWGSPGLKELADEELGKGVASLNWGNLIWKKLLPQKCHSSKVLVIKLGSVLPTRWNPQDLCSVESSSSVEGWEKVVKHRGKVKQMYLFDYKNLPL